MKDRLKEIRKNHPNGGTQDSFAEFLGISKANLASYESGRRKPSEAVLQLICQKCDITKDWLTDGVGEMRKPRTKNQEIGSFANSVMELNDEKFKKRFVEALTRLDEKDWEALEKIAEKLLKEKEG